MTIYAIKEQAMSMWYRMLWLAIFLVFSAQLHAASWSDNIGKAFNYMDTDAKVVWKAMQDKGDDISSALSKAIRDENGKKALESFIKAQDGKIDEAADQLRDSLNDVLKKIYNSDPTKVIGAEVERFVSLLVSARTLKIADNPQLTQKALEGMLTIFRNKGEYRSMRNILTSLHNAKAESAKRIEALKFLDDLGVINKRITDDLGGNPNAVKGELDNFNRWLRNLSRKPLLAADSGWLGAVGEGKVARQLLEMADPAVKLKRWNPLDSKGKLGTDMLVEVNGKQVVVEIKNYDFATADLKKVSRDSSKFASQIRDRHIPEYSGNEGGDVLLIIVGKDVQHDVVDQTVNSVRRRVAEKVNAAPEAKNFTVDNIAFLEVRNGEQSKEAMRKVLQVDSAIQDKIRPALKRASK